jgi:hypothetical protein
MAGAARAHALGFSSSMGATGVQRLLVFVQTTISAKLHAAFGSGQGRP